MKHLALGFVLLTATIANAQTTDPVIAHYYDLKEHPAHNLDISHCTPQTLMATLWWSNYISITFYQDQFFLEERLSGYQLKGSFQVQGTTIVFTVPNPPENVDERFFSADSHQFTLVWTPTPTDFWNPLALKNPTSGLSFSTHDLMSPIGQVYDLKGTKTLKIAEQRKVATQNLNAREKPSTTGAKILTLKAGITVDVFGTTVEKTTIDGLTAPWAYIRFPDGEDVSFGWVFSGYLK